MRGDSPGFSDGLHKGGGVSMAFRHFALGSLRSCTSSDWNVLKLTKK